MDFKKGFTSIWFLALVIAIPVIVVLPPVFEKYNVDLVEEGKLPVSDPATKVYFEDIDSDGKIERFETFAHGPNAKTLSFHFFRGQEGMVDQINFQGKYNSDTRALYFGDTNNDGHKEIFTFSYDTDSLFLNWLNVTPEIGKINSMPICAINYYNDSLLNYGFGKIHCVDLNLDGNRELVFAINGGYSYSPRQIFKVDIENRTVVKSENAGNVNYNLQFSDLNGDGKLEIIADGATAPVRDWFNLPYNKPAPYLKIFNSDLSYFTTPVQFFEGIQTDVFSYVVPENSGKKIISTVLSNSAVCPLFRAYKINLKGEKTDSLVYKADSGKGRSKYVFRNEKGNFVTQIKPGEFLEYSANLKVVNHIKTNIIENLGLLTNTDINNDGINELLFFSLNSKTIHLFSDRFKWHISIPFDSPISITSSNIKLKNNRFYLTSNKGYYIYTFKRNPYYLLRFPGYLAIYLISFLFLSLFQRLIEMRLKEKYELQNQVRELQLKTFRNQLNPHFIFNTFNGVASVIKKGDSETAYKVFIRFSKMVRHILDNFDNDFLTLEKELELVENYIELQKFRFKELFGYNIQIEDNTVGNFIVPRMIVQIRVENAITHGLIPRGGGGMLTIGIKRSGNNLKIVIEDNGIGRARASENNLFSNGIGIKTIEGLVEFINLGNKQKISQQTVDLVDENGNAAGTKIIIIVPSNLNEI